LVIAEPPIPLKPYPKQGIALIQKTRLQGLKIEGRKVGKQVDIS
jgi:hypothetical protein